MTVTKFQLSNLFDLNKPRKQKSPLKNYPETVLGCFRIRNAVIILGLWHLLIHLFGFILYVSARFLMPDYCSASFYGVENPSKVVLRDSYIYNMDSTSSVNTLQSTSSINLNFWSSLSFFSFIATCFLIRGAAKGKSTFLLPFLIIQIFDILSNFFIIGTYLLLSSSTDEFFSQLQSSSFQRFQARSGFKYQRLFILIFVCVSFSMKTYLMRMVYAYYKSLAGSQKPGYERKSLPLVTSNTDNQQL